MINKILGYVLLILGLVLIGWALWQSYNIFAAKTSAPVVFMNPSPEKTSQKTQNSTGVQIFDMQSQIQNVISSQIGQVIPQDTVTKVLNLISWSIFAGILIIAGSAVAGIGIKLIKLI